VLAVVGGVVVVIVVVVCRRRPRRSSLFSPTTFYGASTPLGILVGCKDALRGHELGPLKSKKRKKLIKKLK